MIDMKIEAKSDQLNADDLLGGPRIIRITAIKAGSAEQPVIISYEGDQGKPWKPSKGMRRVLVAAWGSDGEAYIGRSVEVYNDQSVKWAGAEVGGIRISRMSDIKNTIVLPLTLSRGKKTPVIIKPLEGKKELTIEERRQKTIELLLKEKIELTEEVRAMIGNCNTAEELKSFYESIKNG